MQQGILRIYSITTVFLLLIAFPIINAQFHLIKDIESSENRKMTDRPEFDFSALDEYPGLFEKSYNDNFTIRAIMVKYFNKLNIDFFKKSPLPDQIIIGEDKWLFMGGDELDAFRGKHRFEPVELESIRLELEYRKDYLKKRGCEFYFLIAPNKMSIYAEKAPNSIFRLSDNSWGEQLISYLNSSSSVKPVNVFDELRFRKNKETMYYMLDNHWNQTGAFYATNVLLKTIGKDFPEVHTETLTDYELKKFPVPYGNIVSMLSNEGTYSDTIHRYLKMPSFKAHESKRVGYPVEEGFSYTKEYENVREISSSTLPKALIISDSFGMFVYPFFSEEFSRTVKIFDAWRFKLNENIVNVEKPDVYVLIVLESNLRNLLKNQSRKNIH